MTTGKVKTPRAIVQERYPGAWWCKCGCGGIYFDGNRIGGGDNPKEAWERVASLPPKEVT